MVAYALVKDLPFDKPGRFYKGNLHAHSTNSDGPRRPEELARLYREAGYDFLAITDHFRQSYGFPVTDTRPLRRKSFTTLLGAELHASKTALGEDWHLLAFGLPPDFPPTSAQEGGPDLARRAMEAGAFVGIAHPAWYGLTLADAESAKGAAHAVEVYNHSCLEDNDRSDGWYLADALLSQGRRINAFAADDAHLRKGAPDAFGGWVEVRSEAFEPEPILTALKAGHYYSSQGPEIHGVEVGEGSVIVRCSPARGASLGGRGPARARVLGEGITECELPMNLFVGSSHLRVTVVDAAGRRAWTNPVWLDRG
jgi:hypothetical protein